MPTNDEATTLDDLLTDSNSNWGNSWMRIEAMEAAGSDNTWKQFMSAMVWAVSGETITYAHSRVDALGESGRIEVHVFTATRLIRASFTKASPEATPEVVPLHALESIRVLRAPTIFTPNRGLPIPQIMRLKLKFRDGSTVTLDNEQTYTQGRDALLEYYPLLLANLDPQ